MNVIIESVCSLKETESHVKSESDGVRVCCGCLATDDRLYNLREQNLDQSYHELTGLSAHNSFLCGVCFHLLRKFSEFRARCLDASHILQQIHTLTVDAINKLDKSHLKHNFKISEIIYVNCESYKNAILTITDTIHVSVPEESESITFDSDIKTDFEAIDNPLVKYENLFKDDDIEITNNKPFSSEQDIFYDVDMTSLNDNTSCNINNIDNDDDNMKDNQGTDFSNDETPDDTEIGEGKTEKTLEQDKILIIRIVKLFTDIWKAVHRVDGNYYEMFERLYKESSRDSFTEISDDDQKENIHEKINFMIFLKLYKEVAELYNVELEFLSVEEQRRMMNEKRELVIGDRQCALCCKKYRTLETQQRHIKRSHNESFQFKCEICYYMFRRRPAYLLHILKTHAMKIKCIECGQIVAPVSFKKHWEEAKQHLEIHRGAVHTCEFCGKTFTASKYCYMHIRSVHRAQMNAIQCLLCGDSYNGQAGLRRHMHWMHTQAIQCSICSVWFLNEKTYLAHEPEDSFCRKELSGCPLCGDTFASMELMRAHYDEMHARYTCPQCNLTFIELKCYKQHYQKLCSNRRSRGRPKLCGSETMKKKDRTKKRDRAKKETAIVNKKAKKPKQKKLTKIFVCDICGKSDFSCEAKLKYHQRIHTGEKPYKCNQCDKSFRLGPSLQVHMWTHTGERRYKCPHCPKAFRQQNHLRAHMPTHTKIKPYECSICDKRFTQRNNMLEHVRVLHEGMPPKRRTRHRVK